MKETQSKHTKTPWLISSSTLVCSDDAKIIAQCANIEPIGVSFEEARANAQFIITAVNSHDELVKACDAALVFAVRNYGGDSALATMIKKALSRARNL